MNATKLSYLLHVWARFANRSSITMVSSSRMIFRPVFRWEINGRQYLNNHYKTNNSDDKSNYSKLHDRKCHVTSDYSYLFSSRLPPSGWKKRLGRWTISLANELSAWRVTKRNLWRSVTSNRIDQNIFNYDQNEAKSKINKQWSWNNSRWQAWRKTAICEYPNSAGFYFRVRENQGQLYASRNLEVMPVFSFAETKVVVRDCDLEWSWMWVPSKLREYKRNVAATGMSTVPECWQQLGCEE